MVAVFRDRRLAWSMPVCRPKGFAALCPSRPALYHHYTQNGRKAMECNAGNWSIDLRYAHEIEIFARRQPADDR
jgi:hypothetical protein